MLDQTLYDKYFIPEALQAAMLSYAEREHHRIHSPVAEAADEYGAVSAGELVRMDSTWYDSFPVRGALQTYLATLPVEKLQIIAGLAWYGRDYRSEGMRDQAEQIDNFIELARTSMRKNDEDIQYLCEKPLHQYIQPTLSRCKKRKNLLPSAECPAGLLHAF